MFLQVAIILFVTLCVLLILSFIQNRWIIESEYEIYIVQDKRDKEYAGKVIAKIDENLNKLMDHLIQNKHQYTEYIEYIEQLESNRPNVTLSENEPNESATSYTINKEDIIMCLRSKKNDKIHDFNELMYVAIHELAHVACPEQDHTPLFNKINAFMLNVGIEIGIYKYKNYENNPIEYCGMILNTHILN